MFNYNFYWSIVWEKFPELLQGARVTLEVTVLSMIFGTAFALPLSLWRRASDGVGHASATGWGDLTGNTPALFQVYMVYFALGALHIHLPSYFAMVAALT